MLLSRRDSRLPETFAGSSQSGKHTLCRSFVFLVFSVAVVTVRAAIDVNSTVRPYGQVF